jgi:SAM-dependent methyltransferase
MKLNMGCGLNHREGYVNVDLAAESGADVVFDLEQTPWPWADDSVEEAFFNHSLEHMGGDPRVFLAIMKELYRVLRPGGRAVIHVPHPRHDNFLGDPTHVRVITPDVLRLFDRQLNEEWRAAGAANSPLALYTGVDFKLVQANLILEPAIYEAHRAGRLTSDQINEMVKRQANVGLEFRLTIEARKTPPA